MRAIDADELKQTIDKLDVECPDIKQQAIIKNTITKLFPQIVDDEPTLCVVPTKEIYKLRDKLYKLSNDKWDKWESFERSGCDNKYLLGKAHAYSIVVDMIDDLLKDNLGGKNDA